MALPQILCVEDGQSFSGILAGSRFGDARLRCRSANWNAVVTGQSSFRDADVLLPVISTHRGHLDRFLSILAAEPAHAPVLAVLPAVADDRLLESVARGADDFILWQPDRVDELRHRVGRMLHLPMAESSRKVTEALAFGRLVGRDPSFLASVAKIPFVARTESTVLILGETGTGKELCARAIHHLSRRRNDPFVPVDCGAVPEQLLENELFGHARGAFTDAHRGQEGLVAMAQGGSLFLDEIDALPLTAQGKLLRFLENRTYKPLGADRFVQADVRIVAATNADLEALVQHKIFRADLYFRLNVLPLRLPSLRERRGDIPLLARHFLERICAESGIPRKTLVSSAIDKLVHASWPGNVRELFNVLQRAALFADGPLILPCHVMTSTANPSLPCEGLESFNRAKARAVEAFERSYIEALLDKHGGNVTRCAREAGKDRRVFGRLVKKHNLARRPS